MTPITIVDNEYVSVQYLADKKIVYHCIKKPIDAQPLKDALNAGTDAMEHYGACKWLSDDRKNGPLSEEIAEWGIKDWNPRTIAAGWKYWAEVVPEEIAAAGTMMPIIDTLYKMGLRMMVFTTPDAATKWLDSLEC